MPGTIDAPWLLNPGPCNTSDAVKAALSTPDLCHRSDAFFDVQDEARALLLEVFGCDPAIWDCIVVTGSGTCAVETALCSAVSAAGRALVIVNGAYGERLRTILEIHGVDVIAQEYGEIEQPDLAALDAALGADPTIEIVAMVHHETNVGMLNPVAEVSRIVKAHGRRLVMDTVSGLSGETLDLDGVDIAVSSSNKIVQGLPGLGFCLVRRDFADVMAGYPPRSLYLHLTGWLNKQRVRSTPFTPAVQTWFAFRQALRELRDETVEGRIARLARAAARLRAGFDSLGLTYLVDARYRSNTITTLMLPDGVDYQTIYDHMLARGYVFYLSGELAERCFRFANMGLLPDAALDGVISALGELLQG